MSPFLPGARGTQPCPNCGTQVVQSDRYPQYLCAECEGRAVDADGARVTGSNASFGGGFVLHWPDGEHEPLPCISARVGVFRGAIRRGADHADARRRRGLGVLRWAVGAFKITVTFWTPPPCGGRL